MSSIETFSFIWCIVLPTNPNSTTGQYLAINLASEVPPLVDRSGEIFVLFFIFYLLVILKRQNYFYNFMVSFLWLVTLQSSLVLIISVLLWVLPSIALVVALVGAVVSIQILIVQFKIAKKLLDVSSLIAISIVFGNIIVGLLVGLLDQFSYGLFAG